MSFDILTEIIGTKVKIAVLRTLTFSPGISARKIQANSNKSWGGVKQAIDALLALSVIVIKNGKWNDEIFLNTNHCLYSSIINLFQSEKDFLTKIAILIFNYSDEHKQDLLSCYFLAGRNTIYLVGKYPKTMEAAQQIREKTKAYGLPEEFSIEIMGSAEFRSIWDKLLELDKFVLLHGQIFPYLGVERALDFFEINDNTLLLDASTHEANK